MELFAFDDVYVQRLREGDRWTEEHFLHYFQRLLLMKLRGRLRSREAIDDVRQEVFVRVFRTLRADGLHDGRKLGAFVNSICNNVLMEHYRAGDRAETLDESHESVADSLDIEAEVVSAETKARVRRVLHGMQSRDGELLRELFLEERDKDEVCRKFNVDRGYLRVLLHRAKERFREEYRGGVTVDFSASRETKA
ncbi:MAG TPA: sigma-70 family RNA polymerase sigma factor [Thermoanaerobaculia bacterium]